MNSEHPHVIVAGSIGVGKSTFCEAVAQALDLECYLESDGKQNPFLERFYGDMSKWAFHSQSFFLTEALTQQAAIADPASERGAIQDRSVWEHLAIFGESLAADGHLEVAELELLHRTAEAATIRLPDPDLLVFLDAPLEVIKERIAGRGRSYEQSLPENYLAGMLKLYEQFVADWDRSPVLVFETADVDIRSADGAAKAADSVRRCLAAHA